MEKSDSLSLGAQARCFVDEPNAGGATFIESCVDVVNGEAHVMNSCAPSGDEFANWGDLVIGLEKLDERVARGHRRDTRAVRIFYRKLGQSENLPEKRKTRRDGLHGDSNVRDAGALRGFGLH